MLSVCIPIYNFDVRPLVNGLAEQIMRAHLPVEILLIDDASLSSFQHLNQTLASDHYYLELSHNIGRAAIRNRFLELAKYDYLLFLDCDATLISNTLLQVYCDLLTSNSCQVVCGGSVYPASAVDRQHHLRWKNGNKRETISAYQRSLHPYGSFMTSNVVISKSVFSTVRFDESLVKYGHEDTLFGYELKKRKIFILHLDNPVLNNDLDTNTQFLYKTEEAFSNLVTIVNELHHDPLLIEDIKVLSVYFKIQKNPFLKWFVFFLTIFKQLIFKILKSGYAPLFLFDIYKLALLSSLFRKKNNVLE